MKKLILIFTLMSGLMFGQNLFELQYQNHFNKDLSKMKMEGIFMALKMEGFINVIEASENSYYLQFKSDTIKFKMIVSFYDKFMSFTFTDHYYLSGKKWVKIDDKDPDIINLDREEFELLKSEYLNNI